MSPKKKLKAEVKKPTEPFAGWTEKKLRDRVSDITFERGDEYFGAGCVKDLRVQRNEAKAEVEGSTGSYDVRLWDDGKQINGTCDCPAFEDMGFCKHCVAACLALMDKRSKGTLAGSRTSVGKAHWATMDEIEVYLKKVAREKLEGWARTWAEDDADFRQVLEAEVMTARRARK